MFDINDVPQIILQDLCGINIGLYIPVNQNDLVRT